MTIFFSNPEGIDYYSTVWPVDVNIVASATAAAAAGAFATAAEAERLQEDYLISNTR